MFIFTKTAALPRLKLFTNLLLSRNFIQHEQLFSVVKGTTPFTKDARKWGLFWHKKQVPGLQHTTKIDTPIESYVIPLNYTFRHLETNPKIFAAIALPIPAVYFYFFVLDQPYLWTHLLLQFYSHYSSR